jgi:hypothetical protein
VNGAPVRVGSTVRVLFTQDLTGAANTGLVLTYNGVSIPVMVGKNGSLGALLPFDVGSSTYKYLQAYTTLEMTYDGTQFIVLGNPVVISNSDYTVYTDGSLTLNDNKNWEYDTEYYAGNFARRKLYTMYGYTNFEQNQLVSKVLNITGEVANIWLDISKCFISGSDWGTRQPWLTDLVDAMYVGSSNNDFTLYFKTSHVRGVLFYKVYYTKELA